jgi:GT2 family glycosyltransferase
LNGTYFHPDSFEILEAPLKPILKDISLVIPTLGRTILKACFQSILAGTFWPGRIIVVDQSSSLAVAGWIETLGSFGLSAEYIPSSHRGRAAGLNQGLERVTSRFVCITDDDCLVEPDWLEKMYACLRGAPDAIITGRIEQAGENVIVLVTSLTPQVYRRPRLKFDLLSGGNMGTSMSVIARVGLFDEDPCLRTAEDGEWAYRALRAGVPINYTPEVTVRHYGWRNESERTVQYKDYARSHGGFYGKYLRKGDWFIALRLLIHHLRALRRWLRGMVTGDQELALHGQAYLTGLLPGIIAGFRGK